MLLGFGTWVAGIALDFGGIATIGATLVIGVGAMFTATGLEYKVGETTQNQLVNNSTTNDTAIIATQTDAQYRSVNLPQRLPLGVLVIVLGGVGVLRSIEMYT